MQNKRLDGELIKYIKRKYLNLLKMKIYMDTEHEILDKDFAIFYPIMTKFRFASIKYLCAYKNFVL